MEDIENKKKDLKEKYQRYAQDKGFVLQPNEKILDSILTGLIKREEKFGDKYCPCRAVTDDKEHNKKIVCPCFYHEKEVEEDGHCKCFLFMKKG